LACTTRPLAIVPSVELYAVIDTDVFEIVAPDRE
jgi:hypothetical protein